MITFSGSTVLLIKVFRVKAICGRPPWTSTSRGILDDEDEARDFSMSKIAGVLLGGVAAFEEMASFSFSTREAALVDSGEWRVTWMERVTWGEACRAAR